MPAAATRNLFIQIGGSASDLTIAAKAGKSALLDLGAGAEDVQATVRGAFEKLGGSVADQANAMEQAYARTFTNIRSTAQAALAAPTSSGAGLVLNLSAAREEADQAQASASFLRTLSDAQARLVETGSEASSGARSLAVSLELQAIAAEKNALAARETASGLERLAAESGIAVDGLDEVVGAHGRMGASGLIAEHVVRSFSDSLSAGQSPVRAFALEVPRIAEALQFVALESNATEGALAKFAGFMGGGWGLAITLGVSLLAPLVAELMEGGSASDKMHDKVMDLVSALNDEAGATTAAQKALADYNAEKQRGRDQDAQTTQATLDKAKADIQAAIATRSRLQAEAQRYFNEQTNNPNQGGAAQAFAGLALSRLADAQDPHIAALQQGMRNIEIDQAKDAAKSAADPIEAIRAKYKQLADAAEAAAAKNNKLAGSLKGTLITYAQQEAAEIKAAEAKKEAERRLASDNRQVGRQIDLSQAEAIVQGIGGKVTSSYRSTAEQKVLYSRYLAGTGSLAAKPGTSLHETGQALDVAKTAGISLAALKKAFEDAGVHLTEALDEGTHYHVGFGPKGPRAPSAEALARRQVAEDDKSVNQDAAFQSELRAAMDALGQDRDRLPQTPDDRYASDAGKADDDFLQRDAALTDKVGSGKLTAANAIVLEQVYTQIDDLEKQSAALKRDTDLTDQRYALDTAALEAQQDLAKIDEQLAPTREARLKLEQQILAGQQQAYRAQLDRDIANAKSNPIAAENAVIAYQSIDKREAGQRADLARQYASPGQRYVQDLNSTSVSDSLENAGVQGLGHLEDGLDGVLTGTKSVKAAFSDLARSIVADLVKIGIEQALIKPLANNLFGGGGGGGILSLFGGAFGGTTSAGTGSVYGPGLGGVYADGGHISGPGTGRSDSILARVSNGEFVVNANSTKRFLPVLHAINDNKLSAFADGGLIGGIPSMPTLSRGDVRSLARQPAQQVVVHVQANDYFDAKVSSIADGRVNSASPAIANAGSVKAAKDSERRQSRKLGTRG